ncbi:MAG: hypothetical protein JWM36_1130 [Hyphomicrobiales bacterium]|nr:hypothetical protein [Hyphomicrobiales bacterium]
MTNPITTSIIKAIMMIAQSSKPKPVKNPRYAYHDYGVRIQLKTAYSSLTDEQKALYDAGDVHKLPASVATMVRVGRAELLDHSKRYEAKGKREAARRRARMQPQFAIAA